MKVTSLHYYPVKSLKGISLSHVELDPFGVKGDRRYMLIDQQGRFVTQRKYPKLSHFSATVSDDSIEILGSGETRFVFDKTMFSEWGRAEVWGDEVAVQTLPMDALQSLSDILGLDVTLAYMPDSTFRQVDPEFFDEKQRVSFADAFPLLLTNEASLRDLNGRLENPVGMRRFRPNIVVDGVLPFEEDAWQVIRIGNIEFECVKPCSRCLMTTIDHNAQTGREPLKTLATYRKNQYGVCFGENLVHLSEGGISVGDEVKVIS